MSETVDEEITRLDAEIKRLTSRRAELQKLRAHPHVTPVQVYYRYHSKHEEPYDWGGSTWDVLAEAYRSLEYSEDDGQCSAVGIEVGGVLMTMEELRARSKSMVDV